MEMTAAQLAEIVKGDVVGDSSAKICTYAKIEEAGQGALTFLANPKYEHFIYDTDASAVLVRRDFNPEREVKATLIKVDDPYATLADLLNLISKTVVPEKRGVENPVFVAQGVELPDDVYLGSFSYIGSGVKIGRNVKIYPQCYIGDNAVVKDNTVLYAGVKVYYGCEIGSNCIIHSGAVIGSDGFGFAPKDGSYEKIAQIGRVVIEDDVEIGANTTIDRATMGATVVRRGVKLDNLIQVAHNVEIGENTVIAAQTGIAGSTKIGRHNMIGGQVGFAGHIIIGDGNKFGAQAGVHSNPGDGKTVIGYPAIDARLFMRQSAYLKRLGEVFESVKELRKEMEELKNNKKI